MSNILFNEEDNAKLTKLQDGKDSDASKTAKLKDHLYMTYLIVGIVAFSFGILVSYRRLKQGD